MRTGVTVYRYYLDDMQTLLCVKYYCYTPSPVHDYVVLMLLFFANFSENKLRGRGQEGYDSRFKHNKSV